MEIVYISILTLLAATVGTLSGFGTSAIMIPILVMFLPITEAMQAVIKNSLQS